MADAARAVARPPWDSSALRRGVHRKTRVGAVAIERPSSSGMSALEADRFFVFRKNRAKGRPMQRTAWHLRAPARARAGRLAVARGAATARVRAARRTGTRGLGVHVAARMIGHRVLGLRRVVG